MPFFKIADGALSQASTVHAPGYTLDDAADKTKVVDGWYWFGSLNEAMRGMPLPDGDVPQSVTRRQAKTVMELSPHPVHGDLWAAALAAASAITDKPTRVVTMNYLLESLHFEYPTVLAMASQLLGMTSAQVDALFIAAAKL